MTRHAIKKATKVEPADIIRASLQARNDDADDEASAEAMAEQLRGHIANGVPRHRLVKCADCDERVDREDEDGATAACPFCGSTEKTGLFPLTDSGNAERVAFLYGERLRYCAPLGGWLVFDGRRWTPDSTGEVERLALRAIRHQLGEAEHVGETQATIAHATRSESARGIQACTRLAQSHEDLAARPELFDGDPWLLNVGNGTLDLRTRELRKHDPADLLTKIAACDYVPDATSELWERVLGQALGGDAEAIAFVRRLFGYALTGSTSEEKLFLIHGPGGTAKSTIIEACKRTFGDYAMTADFEAFVSKQAGTVRNDIARLAGARLVTSIEVEQGRRLAEGVVKSITGGDDVTARFLFKEAFTYRPQFKLVLVANDAPRARDDDTGLWRRIVRVPFDHVVPEDERDPKVKAELADPSKSGAAILAWCVEGCLEWQKTGLRVPAAIKQATESYRQSQDPLGDFLREECVVDSMAHVTRAKLLVAYECWAKENKLRPIGARELAERLRARGIEEAKWRGDRRWVGVGLKPDGNRAADEADGVHLPHEASAEEHGRNGANGAGGHMGHQNLDKMMGQRS